MGSELFLLIYFLWMVSSKVQTSVQRNFAHSHAYGSIVLLECKQILLILKASADLQWVSWPGRSELTSFCAAKINQRNIINCTHFHSQKVFSIVVEELLTGASDLSVLLHLSSTYAYTWNCWMGSNGNKKPGQLPSDKAVYLKIGNM